MIAMGEDSKSHTRQITPTRQAAFPACARLVKSSEFKRVFKKPMVSADRCFKVLARINESNGPRLGMAVSRQIERSAVGRNRIKRVVRESFRQFFPDAISQAMDGSTACATTRGQRIDGNPPGIDIVILPRREAATLSNRQLFHSLEAHWSRIGVAVEGSKSPAELPLRGRIEKE
jgi:ribonuclease P protein component